MASKEEQNAALKRKAEEAEDKQGGPLKKEPKVGLVEPTPASASPGLTPAPAEDDEMQDVVPEAEVEHEVDAEDDTRQRLQEVVQFHPVDTTLNVIPTIGGRVLMALTEGGMQYLIAGARGSVGLRAGRYMYEVRVVESLNPIDMAPRPGSGVIGRPPVPRQLVRLGFSAGGSSHFLGETEDSICFDSEGYFVANKIRTPAAQKFAREQVLTVVLNLDPTSQNANTLSLFRDGERVCKPQRLPEHLVGKALFPHVAFRNVTLQLNFGPAMCRTMPFKCRPLQDAAQQDAVVTEAVVPEDGKYEVVFPVGLPNEGVFDWLDAFLEKNPTHVELSDRMILDWAEKSGIFRPGGYAAKVSNDKPEMSFGLPSFDDLSVQKVLRAVAPTIPRNYVVMELRANLLQAERKDYLQRFSLPMYKKVAPVLLGEPPEDLKDWAQSCLLRDKEEKAQKEYVAKLAERAGAAEMRLKKLQAEKEGKSEDDADSKPQQDEEEETPLEKPTVELTAAEKKLWFRPQVVPDLTEAVMSSSCGKFSLPDADEGFDDIRFEWQTEQPALDYFKKWQLDSKITTRIEDLQPSAWFKEKLDKWQKTLQEWHAKQKEFREPAKVAARKKLKSEKEPKEGEEEVEVANMEDLDIFSVEDVCNIGDDEPLFGNFEHEDWSLLGLRYEMHLLVHAFKHDTDDPERPGMHESHVIFYFQRYFVKGLSPKFYGHESMKEAFVLVKDTVGIDAKTGVIESQLAEDVDTLDIFVKLTEENRRERQRRIDAGDETAKLKFLKAMPQLPTLAPRSGGGGAGSPGGAAPTWGQARQGPAPQGWAQQRAGLGVGGTPAPQGGVWYGGGTPAPHMMAQQRWPAQQMQPQMWQQAAKRPFQQGGGGWR